MSEDPPAAPAAGAPALAVLRGVLRAAAAHPFSVILAAVILVLALLQRPLFGTARMMRWDMGTGFEPLLEQGHWWSPLTSVFFTPNAASLIVTLILTILLLGVAEHLMGTWRTAGVFFLAAIGGSLAGVGLQWLGSGRGEFWSRHVIELVALDPLTPVAGALLAASGFASALWRRRIRLLTLLVAVVVLLYSGQPADLYRLLAALAGLLLGLGLRPHKQVLRWVRGTQHEIRVLVAAVVAITAAGPVIALVSVSRFGPLAPIAALLTDQLPDATQTLNRCQALHITSNCVRALTLTRISNPGAILLSVAPMILLLVAAYGLLRGRRFAVWLAAAVNILLGLLSLFYFGILPVSGLPYVIKRPSATHWEITLELLLSILLPFLVAVALILLRRSFHVPSSRRRIERYLLLVAGSAVGLAVVYVGGGLLVRDVAFTSAVGLPDLLADVGERFIPVSFLRRETIEFLPSTVLGGLIYYGIGPVFWLIVILGAFRPLADSAMRAQPGAMRRVRAKLTTGGGDNLSFMATWPGNSHWFDPEGESAVTYRVVAGIALTIGGPFGSLGSQEGAVTRFARFCDSNGWTPVFYSIDGSYEGFFRSMGWQSMVVAEETVIRPANWQTTGKKWQDVRTAINRATKAGITAEWTSYAALAVSTANQLAEISEQWVSDRALPEMGFTLGGVDELRDPAVRLMLAIDDTGRVHAVTSWLPTYRQGAVVGWTLDFMRRRPDSSPGVMEFVIAEAATRMRDDGIEFLSLSGAPLAHTANLEDAAGIDRILGYLSSSLEPVYGFRSLLAFKRKFQPEFHPLLMAYPDPAALPSIGIALTRAYLPQLSLANAASLARSGRS